MRGRVFVFSRPDFLFLLLASLSSAGMYLVLGLRSFISQDSRKKRGKMENTVYSGALVPDTSWFSCEL